MGSEDIVEAQLTSLLAMPASDNWPGTAGVEIAVEASDPDTGGPLVYGVTVYLVDGGQSQLFTAGMLPDAVHQAYCWMMILNPAGGPA